MTGAPRTGGAQRRWVGLVVALAARLGLLALVLVGALVVVLTLLHAAPGDAADLQASTPELRATLEAQWGLDRPVWEQVLTALVRALHGDLGTSLTYRTGEPVAKVIAGPALRSLGWLGAALALTLTWGTGLAWITAGRPSISRRLTQAVSIVPVFLLAHLTVHTLNATTAWALSNGWIDRPAWFALPLEPSPLRAVLAVVVLAVASGALTEVHTEVEAALVRIRTSGYVDAARARGAPLWPHVGLHLLQELATIATNRTAFFVGGLVILEKVLMLKGLGAMLWEAALLRDVPLAGGITLVTAAAVVVARLAGDALRMALDPRARVLS